MIRESEWSAPREDCPHPDHWHAPDGDSTEVEVTELVAAFVRALQPEIVVETGTAYAQTTIAIGEALKRNGHGRLWSLDVEPDLVAAGTAAVNGLPVTVLCGSSLEFTPPGDIQFAWFDSLTPLRVPEFRRYLPWLKPGAVVGFHDCGPQHEPLRSQVEGLAGEGLLRPIYLRTPRGVIFAEVV